MDDPINMVDPMGLKGEKSNPAKKAGKGLLNFFDFFNTTKEAYEDNDRNAAALQQAQDQAVDLMFTGQGDAGAIVEELQQRQEQMGRSILRNGSKVGKKGLKEIKKMIPSPTR